jgi:hypothetical protein
LPVSSAVDPAGASNTAAVDKVVVAGQQQQQQQNKGLYNSAAGKRPRHS